ncbi:MAG TPA: hypothetical protein VMB50_03390 [Myxococcales bacterium]|nr:hypothetical protein [Myxococcales bacterium]
MPGEGPARLGKYFLVSTALSAAALVALWVLLEMQSFILVIAFGPLLAVMINGFVASVREGWRRRGGRTIPLLVAAAHAGLAVWCMVVLASPMDIRF